ncbi:MAG: FHA domain-containing protein [Gammaproteobacteria bacterium]|nr:FHA domain-containing protein [Gammaproteobacteria bacterium]
MQELRAEARTIKEVEKRFVDILSRSIEDPKSINRSLRELDPLIFSQDHNWREIISGLNEMGDEFDAYRRVALVKYMQYLAARQDIIKHLYSEKKRYSTNGGDKEQEGPLKDTVILDGTLVATTGEENDEYERLPKGESKHVHLPAGQEMQVLLSKHKCKLANHDGFEFEDEKGTRHKLSEARNIIGRDALSTVVLDPTWRDVSRKHLVIEIHGKNDLQVTDMSAHGTYINSEFLEQTST